MDFLAPLLELLRPFEQGILVIVGGLLTLTGVVYQSGRAYRTELRREARDVYRDLIRKIAEEQQDAFASDTSKKRLQEINVLLEFLPTKKRRWWRFKPQQDARQRCKEAMMWIDAMDDYYLQGFSRLSPSGVHYQLSGHVRDVLGASLRNEPLPKRSATISRLEKAQQEADELRQEEYEELYGGDRASS